MATVNLNNTPITVDTGNDSIVVVNYLEGIIGGRTLDATGFTPTVIQAGHVVIKETATGDFKPMPIDGAAYAALPAGHTIEGIVVASVLTSKPFVGILVRGTINEKACTYAPTEAIKTALPLIRFIQD